MYLEFLAQVGGGERLGEYVDTRLVIDFVLCGDFTDGEVGNFFTGGEPLLERLFLRYPSGLHAGMLDERPYLRRRFRC